MVNSKNNRKLVLIGSLRRS